MSRASSITPSLYLARALALCASTLLVLSLLAMPGYASDHDVDDTDESSQDDDSTQDDDSAQADSDENGQSARGSIKIDDVAFDEETANEVKVGCDAFRIQFFGFEEGTTTVRFTLWSPHPDQDEVHVATVELEDAHGNELSGFYDPDLTAALSAYEPLDPEDYDYKVRVEAVVKERGDGGEITKQAMLFIDCPEAVAVFAGAVAEADDDAEAAEPAPQPTPVGAVAAGTGGSGHSTGLVAALLLVLMAIGMAAAGELVVRRRS